MAEALVQIALENLNSILQQELKLVVSVTKELKKLSSNFTAIQASIADAEERQVKEKSVQDWLAKLKDVAYDVDDILDDWRIEEQGTELTTKSKVRNCLLSPCFCYSQLHLRHDIGHRVKEIREKLDEIADEKSKYNLTNAEGRVETRVRQTSSLVVESEVFGRDQDKDRILDLLLGENSQVEMPVSVISIVGMGGLGKTTLAQLAYNHKRVEKAFDIRMWVCVSEDFDVERLTREIIVSATGSKYELSVLDPLQRHLHQLVAGKRFILVLDDVWSEDRERGEKLMLPLKNAAPGSKVLLTTRNQTVATAMATNYSHHLEVLSEDNCWLLFKQKAFPGTLMKECQDLENIGREIVRKLKGVPLYAKAIGSVMSNKRTKRDWQLVLDSKIWELPEIEQVVRPAMLLSYCNLPSRLKQCLAYCSIIPRDQEMDKHTIIKLWMAQDLLQSEEGREMEQVGEMFFEDLLGRSLFQNVTRKTPWGADDKRTWFKIHDLVHDLAQYVARNESLVLQTKNSTCNLVSLRHLSLMSESHVDLCQARNLRTLMRAVLLKDPNVIHHMRFLRTLDLSRTSILSEYSLTNEFLGAITKLRHLRYLDLSENVMKELPESLSNLCSLQTLRLNGCSQLVKLPRGIGKLISLRHLEIDYTWQLRCLPNGIGQLSCLRTLCKFIVGGETGLKIGELKHLSHLQGELELENLGEVSSRKEAEEAELEKKQDLLILRLWCRSRSEGEWRMLGESEILKMEGVFEGLWPSKNLQVLHIGNYIGSKFPSWMSDLSLSNLVELKLWGCKKCNQLPALGELQSLQSLVLGKMDEVKHIGREFYSGNSGGINGVFPKLKSLTFKYMYNLEEWDLRVEDGEMPCLHELVFTTCPKLKAMPDMLPNTLRELEIDDHANLTWTRRFPSFLEKLVLSCRDEVMLKPLPDLPNIKVLHIFDSDKLVSFPYGLEQLKTLQKLEISHCGALERLPEGLPQLTTLQKLEITSCPGLEKRCREGTGKDWHKIAHIPNIQIGTFTRKM